MQKSCLIIKKKYIKNYKAKILTTILLSIGFVGVSDPIYASVVPNLVVIKNPCSEAGLSALKSDVYKIAKKRRPREAWELTQILLCGQGSKAMKFIFNHMQEQKPNTPNILYANGVGERVEIIFKSKKDTLEDKEYLLTKGQAYETYVSRVNLTESDPYQTGQKHNNYIYIDAIKLNSETGKNNGKLGWTYYLFFTGNQWIVGALNPVID